MSEHPYEELPGLLFGELNRAEVMVVSDHLAGCDDCRRELAVLAATSASLRATARQAQAPPPRTSVPSGPARSGPPRGRQARPAPPLGHSAGPAVQPGRAGRGRPGRAGGTGPDRPGRRPRPGRGRGVVLWAGPLRPDRAGRTVPLAGVGAVAASGRASMAGDGGDRQMTVRADDLPALRPGQYYEVWLLDPDAGTVFPVGVLPPDGEGRFTLPASVVGRYQVIDVSLEADDGDPAHSKRSLLRGRYA